MHILSTVDCKHALQREGPILPAVTALSHHQKMHMPHMRYTCHLESMITLSETEPSLSEFFIQKKEWAHVSSLAVGKMPVLAHPALCSRIHVLVTLYRSL